MKYEILRSLLSSPSWPSSPSLLPSTGLLPATARTDHTELTPRLSTVDTDFAATLMATLPLTVTVDTPHSTDAASMDAGSTDTIEKLELKIFC